MSKVIGSGGGGGIFSPHCGGSGNTPPVSPPQGKDGGDGMNAGIAGGGGGGGCGTNTGGNGGTGIVVLRAPGPSGPTFTVAPGTNSKATLPGPAGGCTVMTFTVSGTLTIS